MTLILFVSFFQMFAAKLIFLLLATKIIFHIFRIYRYNYYCMKHFQLILWIKDKMHHIFVCVCVWDTFSLEFRLSWWITLKKCSVHFFYLWNETWKWIFFSHFNDFGVGVWELLFCVPQVSWEKMAFKKFSSGKIRKIQ